MSFKIGDRVEDGEIRGTVIGKLEGQLANAFLGGGEYYYVEVDELERIEKMENIKLTETLELSYGREIISYITKVECKIDADTYTPYNGNIIARANLDINIYYNEKGFMAFSLPISGIFESCSKLIIKSVSVASHCKFCALFVIEPLPKPKQFTATEATAKLSKLLGEDVKIVGCGE